MFAPLFLKTTDVPLLARQVIDHILCSTAPYSTEASDHSSYKSLYFPFIYKTLTIHHHTQAGM